MKALTYFRIWGIVSFVGMGMALFTDLPIWIGAVIFSLAVIAMLIGGTFGMGKWLTVLVAGFMLSHHAQSACKLVSIDESKQTAVITDGQRNVQISVPDAAMLNDERFYSYVEQSCSTFTPEVVPPVSKIDPKAYQDKDLSEMKAIVDQRKTPPKDPKADAEAGVISVGKGSP